MFRYIVCDDELGPLFRCISRKDALEQRDRLRAAERGERQIWAEDDDNRILEWGPSGSGAKVGHGSQLQRQAHRPRPQPLVHQGGNS